jgi:3-hydroxyacyl-[acyl-carrier-protein] dehydratase
MRFCQLDQITLLEPGVRIHGLRKLRAEEDYLRDHFPRFAVMPGVLMLEALTQAAILLARVSDPRKAGLVYLEAAKGVKFADFVQPGETLSIAVEIIKRTEDTTLVKATGKKEDSVAVSGRLMLKHKLLSETGAPSTVDRHAEVFMEQLINRLMKQTRAS